MSDQQAVRAVALSEATKVVGSQGPEAVLTTAKTFFDFLTATGPSTKTSSAAGADPAPQKEGKPSANTAGASKTTSTAKTTAGKKATATPKKEEPAAEEPEVEGDAPPTDPIEASAEGVALAVKLLIEADKRDSAIGLLKKYKAASVSSMQKKSEDEIIEFVGAANELLGLGGEPSLD